MKKIFEKQHNLLFVAAAVMFLQLLCAVIYFYAQAILFGNFGDACLIFYIIYCLAVCVISCGFLSKNKNDNINIKLWFAGFFMYAFFEILLSLKMLYIEFAETLESEFIVNLWDNQHLYRLFICAAVIILIYCASFVFENKKLYIILAGLNLFIAGLFILFVPDMRDLLLEGSENIFEVSAVVFIRETGIILLTLNIFIFAMYKYYNYKEN